MGGEFAMARSKAYGRGKMRTGFVMKTIEPGELTSVAPEFQIRIKWSGEDFDKKGINIYADIRKMLLGNHLRTVNHFMPQLLRDKYRRGAQIVIDNGLQDSGLYIGELGCGLSCDVPFTHKGKAMTGHLAYSHFTGTG
jgi:hypothetical protein